MRTRELATQIADTLCSLDDAIFKGSLVIIEPGRARIKRPIPANGHHRFVFRLRKRSERAAKIDRDKKAVRLLPIPRLSLRILSGSKVAQTSCSSKSAAFFEDELSSTPPSPRAHGTQFVPWLPVVDSQIDLTF